MNTRTWLVIAAVAFYFWWSEQAQATATQQGAAGTPVGTTPVSTLTVTPQSPTLSTGNPVTAIANGVGNLLGQRPGIRSPRGVPLAPIAAGSD